MTIGDLLANRARLTPDREALAEIATGKRYSYAELNDRANRVANGLRGRAAVVSGDRVCLLAYNSVIYLDLLFGLPKFGAIFVPLNWRLSARELAQIIADCAPRVLIVGREFAATLVEVRHLIPALDFTIVAAEGAEAIQCILYTSGTTGRAKGALIPRRQVLWNCINTVISWGLSENDVTPVFTPLFHTGGLFAFMAPILYAGGRVVLTRGFDAAQSLRLIEDERCTVILGVPTLFKMWRDHPAYAGADFSQVRFFISGGAPCPAAMMEAWRAEKGVVFRQGYGLTEAGTNCFTMTDVESVSKQGSVGKPIFHSEMRVRRVDGGDAAADEVGELLIRGPHVFAGYWNNSEATAAALQDGWLHTGDMVRRDAEGFYTIVGRIKDMIISGGENIYAAEVEAVLREHPTVEDAALIGRPDEQWGEIGLAVVVARSGRGASASELLAFCGARLARYKVPKEIIFATELPYSPYGKVQKAELRARYLQGVD